MGTLPYAKKNNPNSRNIRSVIARQRIGELPASNKSDCNRDPVGRPVSEAVWEVMQQCWEHNPTNRPTASMLVERLENANSILKPVFSDTHPALTQLELKNEPVVTR